MKWSKKCQATWEGLFSARSCHYCLLAIERLHPNFGHFKRTRVVSSSTYFYLLFNEHFTTSIIYCLNFKRIEVLLPSYDWVESIKGCLCTFLPCPYDEWTRKINVSKQKLMFGVISGFFASLHTVPTTPGSDKVYKLSVNLLTWKKKKKQQSQNIWTWWFCYIAAITELILSTHMRKS